MVEARIQATRAAMTSLAEGEQAWDMTQMDGAQGPPLSCKSLAS